MKSITLILLAVLWTGTNMAQSTKEAQIANWERAKAYTMEYLQAMPEAGYALKPTPEIRSFGEQMAHLADANYAFASGASGMQNPSKTSLEKQGELSKAALTQSVAESYDFVLKAIESMNDADFDKSIKLFGMDINAGSALDKAFEHQSHHRGQCTVYLRLNGTKPPQEKLF
ncbi:DinB family protein [Dyadobacter tibetensis]|uniref:DinB family protein n=1 Tax=Dyadobacter tibetensis TaxID=1211851 RepID=UPI00046FC034|nr:DinB family protein [Dyadobacter tibetensis]